MGNIYTAASGMIAYQTKLEVIGNNIANLKTNGYKKDHETFRVFEEGLRNIITSKEHSSIGHYQHQVHVDHIQTNYSSGPIELTGRPLDLSLTNKSNEVSFFEVQLRDNKYLTRDGHFQVDNEGNLATANGAFLLDTNGKSIKISNPESIVITSEGVIQDTRTGKSLAQIQIRTVESNNTGFLQKSFGNMYEVISYQEFQTKFGTINETIRAFDQNPSLQKILKNKNVLIQAQNSGQIDIFSDNRNAKVSQHSLEQSNVDVAYEMNEMLLAQKGYQANAKAEMTMDKINERDASLLGV